MPRCPIPILAVGILLSIHQRGADGLVLQDHSFEASLGFPVNGGCRNNGGECLLANIDTRCGYDDDNDDGLYQVFVKANFTSIFRFLEYHQQFVVLIV